MNITHNYKCIEFKVIKLLLAATIFLVLSACGSNSVKSLDVEGSIEATSILNPDINGGYKPVNIKVYYLNSDSEFSHANFTDLYKHTDKVLSSSILHISSHQLRPGQTLEIDDKVSSDLKYIGVVAAFMNIQDAKWKTIKAIPEKCFFCTGPGLWDPITITIDKLTVKLDLGNETE
jgi:type VI secretion system protein VasD